MMQRCGLSARFARRDVIAACALVGLQCFANSAAATPIDIAVNGSFEIDDISTDSIGSLLAPVTGWDSVPLLIDGEPSTPFPSTGADGSQYADCGNVPSPTACTQSFTVASGFELLEITWSSNNATVVLPSTPYSVEIRDVLDSILASGTYFAPSSDLVWTAADLDLSSLSLGAGDYKLVIFGTAGVSLNDVFIDDVAIFVEAIPEPGSALLLSFGLSLLAHRRKVSRAVDGRF